MSQYVSQPGVQPFHVQTFHQEDRARLWGRVVEAWEPVYEDFFTEATDLRPGQ